MLESVDTKICPSKLSNAYHESISIKYTLKTLQSRKNSINAMVSYIIKRELINSFILQAEVCNAFELLFLPEDILCSR